jgi:DNA-binding NarL/FixJ family response regulator
MAAAFLEHFAPPCASTRADSPEEATVIEIVSSRAAFAGALALYLEPSFGPVRVTAPEEFRPGTEMPDILVIDSVQNGGALRLVRELAFSVSAPRIVALVSRPSDYIASQAREAGARAILSDLDGLGAWTEIVGRIEEARFQSAASFEGSPRILRLLTRRQIEVFRCILRGLTDEEIGQDLGIATSTAETHRRDLMRKVGVSRHDRLPLVGVQLGVIDPSELPPLSALRQASRSHLARS